MAGVSDPGGVTACKAWRPTSAAVRRGPHGMIMLGSAIVPSAISKACHPQGRRAPGVALDLIAADEGARL
jgi:hypothetical protein